MRFRVKFSRSHSNDGSEKRDRKTGEKGERKTTRNLNPLIQLIRLYRRVTRWIQISADVGFGLALALGLLAAWPFFINPGLPRATDAELHIIRTAELGFSLRAGNPYPRWAPDFYYGYGYPIFNYYAPLTYHLGNWLTAFHPQWAVNGAKAVFILAHLLSAAGAYNLGKLFGGARGGLLGAAAFALSPYILLINPHIRGDLAEVFALALFPWMLWSWERLWRNAGWGNFAFAVLVTVALVLSHNLTALTAAVVLSVLTFWRAATTMSFPLFQVRFRWTIIGGLLVAMLTAYFWLPFLAERHAVRLNVAGEGHYDYHNHFVNLLELLAPLHPLDRAAAAPLVPMSAGIVNILLSAAGLTIASRKTLQRLMPYLILSGTCFLLILPVSESFWDALPLMRYYQFPWRFLGPLAALTVPLVSTLGKLPQRPRWLREVLTMTALAALGVSAMPALHLPPWERGFDSITPADIVAFELEGRWRGTTSTDDFIPTTVDVIPNPQRTLLASFQAPPLDRVNRATLPQGATVEVLPSPPWHNRFRVCTSEPFILRLYLFQFPGWRAYVDGNRVPIEIAHPEGFVTLRIPQGEHDVLVRFEDTPPRRIGWGIALLGIAFLLISRRYFPSTACDPAASPPPQISHWLTTTVGGIWALLLIAEPFGWFYYTSPPYSVRAVRYPQQASFGGEIRLLGYDLRTTQVSPGQAVEVTLYWQAERPVTETYQSFVHLVCPEGQIWAQSDHLNPGGFPTNLWPTDRYIPDKHRLTLPPNAPLCDYRLSVGIYKLWNNSRLPVVWATTGERSDNIVLSQPIKLKSH